MKTTTIVEQIACLKRELAMRGHVYPRRVADGKMKQAQADHEIACMTGALHNLEDLQLHQAQSQR